MICKTCGEPIQMNRRENRTLSVGCDCEARSIRVAQAIPEEWV